MPMKVKSRLGAVLKGSAVYPKPSRLPETLAQVGKLAKGKLPTARQIAAKKAAAVRAKRAAEALGDVRRRNQALSEQADRLLERFG